MAGIYVHIPFCHAKCAYCDFFSGPRRVDAEAYADAVEAEYEARRHELGGEAVTTVYFGGGTPSSLPLDVLRRLVRRFATLLPVEFTVEVNPEDVSPELARMLAEEGANRVSMGVQSLDDTELRLIGRRHSADEARRAVDTLRRAGIGNLCLDLIYGLPGQSLDSWRRSLDGVLMMQPEHLSCYALSYEQGTRLWAMRLAGKVSEAPEELSEAMYGHLCATAAASGYEHYEIANFARPGLRSHHNSAYWDFTPYLGLGAGAHSFDGTVRRYNAHDIRAYMASPATFAAPEEENDEERLNDYIMVALRTARGIDLDFVARRWTVAEADRLQRLAAPGLADGTLTATSGGFRIAEAAWLIADPITIALMR